MGLPIPYGNLGIVIPELFLEMDRSIFNLVEDCEESKIFDFSVDSFWRLNLALRVNSLQIRQYLDTYHSILI